MKVPLSAICRQLLTFNAEVDPWFSVSVPALTDVAEVKMQCRKGPAGVPLTLSKPLRIDPLVTLINCAFTEFGEVKVTNVWNVRPTPKLLLVMRPPLRNTALPRRLLMRNVWLPPSRGIPINWMIWLFDPTTWRP